MKNDLKNEILKIAKQQKTFQVNDIRKNLCTSYSRQHLSSIMTSLVQEEVLLKSGSNKNTRYALKKNSHLLGNTFHKRYRNENLSEDKILLDIREENLFKKNLPENIQSILEYAISEMTNNAIEHSLSKNIEFSIEKTDSIIKFQVRDFGIGVFRNVKKKFNLNTEYDAIGEILKGKITTQPKTHSGEGIFFTSKIADRFSLDSFKLRLIVDNRVDDVFVDNPFKKLAGTLVTFEIDLNTKKHLSDIFKEYQSNPDTYAFDRTSITVKLYTLGTIYMSRSQARRILSNLEKFNHIVFDFKDVPTVGQAFADEIFRVYKEKRPDVVLEIVNANQNVDYMIRRAS